MGLFFYSLSILIIEINFCSSAEILYISLTPSRSHYIWDRSLAESLRTKGHRITFVSHFYEHCLENFTSVQVEGVLEKLHDMKSFDISNIKSEQSFFDVQHVFSLFTLICELNTRSEGLKQLLSLIDYDNKFDILLIDLLCAQCLYPIIEKLNVPVIGTSQFGLMPFFTYFLGSDVNFAYIPVYKLSHSDQMSFYQKMYNYFYGLLMLYWRQYVFMPEQWTIAKRIFGRNISTYQFIESKISLILANYNPVLDYPQSLPPTIIPVGGLHAQRKEELPQDLQDIMDNSKNGIILFSLGTNILSTDLRCPIRLELIKAFSQLKHTIIWKFENPMIDIPDNIIIRKWLPQNAILAHPKMKLFISHGGALSTQEAMIHAVPLVVVPMFADQFSNAEKIVHRNLGVRLHFHELRTDKILDAIYEVTNNTIYKSNMQKISRRYHDQNQDPLSKAVNWVQYVLEHNDTNLHVSSRYISWFTILHLDIWMCILSVLFIIFCLIYNIHVKIIYIAIKFKSYLFYFDITC